MKVYASDEGPEDWKYEWLKNDKYQSRLLREGDIFQIGEIKFETLHTPGHTPESLSFLVTDLAAANRPMGLLSGDFVFVGDVGRPDLLEISAGKAGAMKPAAKTLFKSAERFKSLPEYLQVWPAHGSGSACGKGMSAVPESTVGYELQFSPAFRTSQNEVEFVDYILTGQPEPPPYFGRMKKMNKEGPPLSGTRPEPPKIKMENMVNLHGTIVDTRDRHLFMKRHLPDSLLVSFDDNFSTVAGSYLNPGDDLYFILNEADLDQIIRDLGRVGLDRIRGYVTTDDLDRWNGRINQIDAIDFDEVKKSLNNPDVQILDVRGSAEYADGHLPNSKNIAHTLLAVRL
jgi:hydroxyacylglutathione hydrolase